MILGKITRTLLRQTLRPAHLDTFAQDTGEIVHPPPHQRDRLIIEHVHPKLDKVRLEGDTRPVIGGLAGRDLGGLLDRHVRAESLAVAAPAGPVASLDDKLGREDVGQLGAVSVPASSDLYGLSTFG